MRLCLVEDLAVCALEPLTLTRPVHELLLGGSTLANKIARALEVGPGPQRRSCLIRSHLVDVQRQRDPHIVVNDRDWLARGPVVVANGRWVPPAGFVMPDEYGSWVGLCDGQPACAWVGPDDAIGLEPLGVDSWFEQMTAKHGGLDVGGEWIERPWDLVTKNGAHLERDFATAGKAGVTNRHLAKLALVGPVDRLWIHETARIDPWPSTVFFTIERADHSWSERLGAAILADRRAVLDRRRIAALPG